MKNFETLCIKIWMLLVVVTFTQCASSQKIDMKASLQIKDSYFQEIPSGMADGPTTLFVSFEIEKNNEVELTYAFFRGKKIELKKTNSNPNIYEGNYVYPAKMQDLIMSGDSKEEFKNQLPEIERKIPFELKANECMLQYIQNGEEKLFKIENLKQIVLKNFPM
ncbi:hypothetical protein [Aquimarina algiphila]|uniref:hypothetical protein n=1 Tax=Aquimarina algiphila TaxID=2047982 RepID=UPI00232BF908|nr:hypothetical protein [Aquimarina algiphila]